MIKALVLGGSGFLGSELCNQLVSDGSEVISYDNLSTGRHSFLSNLVHTITADINDSDTFDDLLKSFQPTHIFYLAALHHIPTAESDPHLCIKNNITGLSTVLSVLSKQNRCISFAFASTGGVYKDLIDSHLLESSPIEPVGIYPLSKFWGEQLIMFYRDKYPHIFTSTIFRLFNLVGRNETNDHLVPAILQQLKSRPATLYHGNLLPKRDYIHVSDAARAFYLWANADLSAVPNFLNVCSGVEYSVRHVIDICMEVTDCYPTLSLDPLRLRVHDRLHQLGSNTLLSSTLSWSLSHNLIEAISELWDSIV